MLSPWHMTHETFRFFAPALIPFWPKPQSRAAIIFQQIRHEYPISRATKFAHTMKSRKPSCIWNTSMWTRCFISETYWQVANVCSAVGSSSRTSSIWDIWGLMPIRRRIWRVHRETAIYHIHNYLALQCAPITGAESSSRFANSMTSLSAKT